MLWGCIGIMEHRMETTIGLNRVYIGVSLGLLYLSASET